MSNLHTLKFIIAGMSRFIREKVGGDSSRLVEVRLHQNPVGCTMNHQVVVIGSMGDNPLHDFVECYFNSNVCVPILNKSSEVTIHGVNGARVSTYSINHFTLSVGLTEDEKIKSDVDAYEAIRKFLSARIAMRQSDLRIAQAQLSKQTKELDILNTIKTYPPTIANV